MARRSLLFLMLLVTTLVWSAQWHWSQTIDEPQHLWAGLRILQQGDWTRFDNSKMPVSVLNAAGWLLSQRPNVQGSWFWARAPQVLWLLATLLLVFRWVKENHGKKSALLAAALVGLDPNLMAHAGLVTTDLPCTFAILLACFTWHKMLKEPNLKHALIAGSALGFAQAAKFTALFLGPILGITTILWCLFRRSAAPLRRLHWAVLAALFTLNLTYAFSGTFTTGRDIQWKSKTFQPLHQSTIPLPVPKPWIEGADWVKHDDDIGQGYVYAGEELTTLGVSDHYLRVLPRKFPIPLLLLGLLGLFHMVRRSQDWQEKLTLLVPPIFLLGWFSLAFNCQVGIRYLLPIIPFLALWAARLPTKWLTIGVTWTLLSGLSWWPWGLSYFNETVPDRTQAWSVVADSDLDWGQTDQMAEQWQSDHPDGLVDPDVPAPGAVLLSANRLTGVLGNSARMECYRKHFPPTEHLAYALYPIHTTAQDFSACFPVVKVSSSEGPYPAGEHLLIIRFTGKAELKVGDHTANASGDKEMLLGAVVLADSPFSANWTIPTNATVYLNGAPIGGKQP
jgi:4-amino-4-deoxy-L-arabinose transferase-like glycosyltransferase